MMSIAVLSSSIALAAPQARVGEDREVLRTWVDVGWDPTWVVEAGVARRDWEGAVRLPLVLVPSLGGVELEGGRSHRWGGPLGVEVGATGWNAWNHDLLGTQVGVGTDLWVRPGLYRDRTTVAGELGWRQGLVTWVHHSEAVRDLFVGEAPHGAWIGLPSTRLRGGLATAALVSQTVAIGLSGGLEWTPTSVGGFANPSLGQLPFTVHLTVEVRP